MKQTLFVLLLVAILMVLPNVIANATESLYCTSESAGCDCDDNVCTTDRECVLQNKSCVPDGLHVCGCTKSNKEIQPVE